MPSPQKQSRRRGRKWMWSWRMRWEYSTNYKRIKAPAKRYERYTCSHDEKFQISYNTSLNAQNKLKHLRPNIFHIVSVWLKFCILFNRATLRVSGWLMPLPRILLLYRDSCHGGASCAEWKWMFLISFFNSLKRMWHIPFYARTLCDYFNEPHLFENCTEERAEARKDNID